MICIIAAFIRNELGRLSKTLGMVAFSATAVGCAGSGGSAAGTSAAQIAAPVLPTPGAPKTAAIWRPTLTDSFQWQLSGAYDATAAASVYDLDAFETPSATITALHNAGRHAVCYVNAGAYQSTQPDAAMFPPSVIGAPYAGYAEEKWLDIRQIPLLAPIMNAKMDVCRNKGFDAVEPDNIDGWLNVSGFPLTADDQLAYNSWFADQAHARGMSIALKNDSEQVAQLLPKFDFVISEDCFHQAACASYAPFITANKPVFAVEYTDVTTSVVFHQTYCPSALAAKMSATLKNRSLDAAREVCP